MMFFMLFVQLSLWLLLTSVTSIFAAEIDCTDEDSLSSVISCVKSAIQPKNSELYSPVTNETVLTNFYYFIKNVTTSRQCDLSLPESLSSIFKSKYYVEGNTTYCIIYNYQDVNNDGYFDDGQGVYIVNMNQNFNPVSIAIPHPLYDTNTPALGIDVFAALKGHSFSIATAHRHANAATSSCQSSYKVADVVHNIDNFYFYFHKAIQDLSEATEDGPLPHIQFHATGASTCQGVNVFISSGFSDPPHESSPATRILNEAKAQLPSWNISYPDDVASNGCNLYGTGNTVGRMMNGVPHSATCTTAADKNTALPSSVFVHIEMKWDYRSSVDWVPVMAAAFPTPTNVACASLPIKSGYKGS